MNEEIKGRSILIAGFGREGKSVLEYLQKHKPEAKITVADKNPPQIKDPKIIVKYGKNYLADSESYDTVIRSPGIAKNTPELLTARHITTPTNIFFSKCPGRVIGVTGTKGKSTTSSLIYQILSAAKKAVRLVGNIEKPALSYLDGVDSETFFVCELSSYQLDDFHYRPLVAVVLPIAQEHLTYHGSFENYMAAKSHLVEKQEPTDYVIYYVKNRFSSQVAQKSKGQKIPYPANGNCQIGAWVENNSLWVKAKDSPPQILLKGQEIPLLGTANLENCCAAISAALIFNIDLPIIKKALRSFKPLEHRLELVGEYGGIWFYNDSLATTPIATIHALEALKSKVITLIAGGYDRGLDYSELGKAIALSQIKNLILFPDTGARIAKATKQAAQRPIIIKYVNSMEEAVRQSMALTPKEGICLLSPSSASFNFFKDYADRGNSFKHFVKLLAAN